MKLMKKMVALLLCFVLLATNAPLAFAANDEANIYGELTATQVEVGDQFTFTLYIKDMTASGIKAGFYFDNTKLEVSKITWEDITAYSEEEEDDVDIAPLSKTTKKKANEDGSALGVYVINMGVDSECYEGLLVTVIFKAIANGEAKITLREETLGTDEFKSDSVETLTVTVGSGEPEHVCTPGAVSYEKGTNGKHTKIVACADNCGLNYSETEEFCSGGTADCEHAATCAYCGNTYGEAKGHGKTNGFRYVHNNGTDTHDVICADCQKTVEEDVACTFEAGSHVCKFACGNETDCADNNNDHNCDVCGTKLSNCGDNNNDHNCDVCDTKLSDCADNNSDHKCDVCDTKLSDCADNNSDHNCDVCGDKLTDCADGNNDHKCDVCDTKLSDCADNNKDHKCDVCGTELSKCSDKTGDKNHDCDVCGKPGITQCAGGTATCLNPAVCSECGKEYGDIDLENHVGNREIKYIDNGDDHIKKVFYPECEHVIDEIHEPHSYGDDFICDNCGHELAGWVEMNGNWYYVIEGEAVTGAARVPYPTEAINGKTYGPNAEDKAYAESHAGSQYTDAETAVFVFDENGVFQSDFTGLVGGNRYAVNGVIAWHVGLVQIGGEYYYFAGDVNGGGNIMATGKVYASRNNTGLDIVSGGIYYFGEDGKLCQYEGIVEIDGKKCYFDNGRLMIGAGVTEYNEELIYVRSTGEIIVGRKYWITAEKSHGLCNVGMYSFDENGFMQTAKDPKLNGLVQEGEDLFYYKNGMPYYAGLVEIDGDIYYFNQEGKAVTGTYYITKVDNYTGSEYQRGDKLTFGADGKLIVE